MRIKGYGDYLLPKSEQEMKSKKQESFEKDIWTFCSIVSATYSILLAPEACFPRPIYKADREP